MDRSHLYLQRQPDAAGRRAESEKFYEEYKASERPAQLINLADAVARRFGVVDEKSQLSMMTILEAESAELVFEAA